MRIRSARDVAAIGWGLQRALGRSVALAAGLVMLGIGSLASCAGPNLWTDMSSVSVGQTGRGRLRQPARLRLRGKGYRVPEKWRNRGNIYGTDELVAAVQHAAARVRARYWRATAGIADLSPARGGRTMWHKSHQSGRDVDVLFYTKGADGKAMLPPEHDMIVLSDEGKPVLPAEYTGGYEDPQWKERRLDARKTWLFVETLLRDPTIRVQWIFISRGLESLLLAEARKRKRPGWLIAYADQVMSQPGDALAHNDHMHIRVYCSRSDRFHGCVDRGPVWQHEKKAYKYGGPERYDPVLWRQLAAMTGQTGG
ncbi:MAG: penicillin-insensitive murein endopeptidase [Myxococcota bacterium]